MKKLISIENLLRWTYRDELPKEQVSTGFLRGPQGYGTPWGSVTKTGMLGQPIDEPDIRNRYGVVPDLTAQGGAHPDAVRVWIEVQDLANVDFVLPDDWYPLADLGDLKSYSQASLGPGKLLCVLTPRERLCPLSDFGEFENYGRAALAIAKKSLCVRDIAGRQHLKRSSVQLLEHFTLMGTVPDWRLPPPEETICRKENGTPRWFIKEPMLTDDEGGTIEIEADGMHRTRRRPKMGAYLKVYLDPDPILAAIARIEYRIWHSALGILAERLAGRLDDHDVVASDRPAEPWEGGAPAPPRVLMDLRTPQPEEPVAAAKKAKRKQAA